MGIIRKGLGILRQPDIFIAAKSYRRFPIFYASGIVRALQRILCLGPLLVLSASVHGQTFDTKRCPDRTQTGIFHCDIRQPIVSRPEWIYQNVQFAPGDTVYVGGEGCVQTGGHGPTWKRYVNPSGDNSDHLYHGQVLIPSARLPGTDVGNSLTRIRDVVGRAITVTGEGVPVSDLVLHVGYEDDGYSDNNYDMSHHDDGTEDQCKTDLSPAFGGPAQLDILICRGVACEPVGSRYPFDVLSSWTDPNGFLWNPHWSWQERPGNRGQVPNTSICHEFSKQDVLRAYKSPNFPDCTDQTGIDRVDSRNGADLAAAIPGAAIAAGIVAGPVGGDTVGAVAVALGLEAHDFCTAGKVLSPVTGVPNDSFAGHVNWFPVTVEGSLSFSGFEKYGDDDYDFSLVTLYDCISSPAANCGGSLYTNDPGRNFLHVEFDSDETVDHFASQEWQMAKAAVESGNKDDINKYLKGYTIMTGMFGLDGEHGLKSEIHPIYAMATREENSEIGPSDEVWLMFVRNLGDEGFCSSHIWSSGFTDYTFRLPWRDGMTSVTVDWSKSPFDASEGTTATPTVQVVPPGSGLPAPVAGGVQQSGKTSPVVGSGIVGVQKAVSKTAPVAGQSKSGSSGAAPTIAGVDKSVLKGTPILGVNNPVGSAGALDPSRTANANVGVYVTFHLGPSILPPQGISGTPASTPYIDGALHLVWSGPSSAVGPISAGNLKAPAAIASKTVTTTAKAAPAMTAKTAPPVVAKIPLPVIGSTTAPEDANEIEQKIAAAIEHLSPAQKTTVLKARVLPLVTHPATSGNSVQILKPPPAAGVTAVKTGAHQPVAGSSGVAVEKLVRDAALVHALCAATNNAPFGLPPEICKSDAPK